MRVAILSHQAPSGDAIGNGIADKADFFRERGAQVKIFLEQHQHIHPKLRPLVSDIGPGVRSQEPLVYMAEADLVLVEFGQYFLSLGLLPLLSGGKPRIVIDYHGITPPKLWSTHNREALLEGWQRRGIAWCADRVILHSQFAAEELRSACQFPAERTSVLAHHVESGALNPARTRTINVRAELGLSDCKIALFVGRVAPNKRLDVAIRALAQLRHAPLPVYLLIVGSIADLYRQELDRCLELASALGVGDRVHVLGQVDAERLKACYDAADVFVMPSIHEGFCIPVLEAMSRGLPVVAAHAGALPETVGDAGLLFAPNDDRDLADRLRMILQIPQPTVGSTPQPTSASGRSSPLQEIQPDSTPRRRLRVAVVSFRFGTSVVGGAEKSLTSMALALQDAGAGVEVFSTCTHSESGWTNELPAGTTSESSLLVHRFPVDRIDRPGHDAVVRTVLDADGQVPQEVEQEFIRQSIHSRALLTNLRSRIDEFDAVVTGPYLAGLTLDLCRAFPEKLVLAPCFHDEAIVRLKIWQQAYRQVGAILYHSAVEKTFAEVRLGLNHPRSFVLGTWLDHDGAGEAARGRQLAGTDTYLLYCGRYSSQKNLPLLLEWMEAFNAERTQKLVLVLAGKGAVTVPDAPWCRNLGFLDDQAKADLMAGAVAVVNLSVNESLSLVALEGWANGTPLIAHAGCAVLVDLIKVSGGGIAVANSTEFRQAVNDLLEQPQHGKSMGSRARKFVAEAYGSRGRYMERLLDALFSLAVPLAKMMQTRGKARAADYSLARWRAEFGQIVEQTLDEQPEPVVAKWSVQTSRTRFQSPVNQETILVPIRLRNDGNQPAFPDGPAAHFLIARTRARSSDGDELPPAQTILPGVIIPGEEVAVVVRAAVPQKAGRYRVEIRCLRGSEAEMAGPADAIVELSVTKTDAPIAGNCGPALQAASASLSRADQRHALPDSYIDVTEGRLSGLKRRIKQKLLGNFKNAYVDVLSRQQTAFNRTLVQAVQETLECCTLLNHAVASSAPRGLQQLTEEWSQTIESAVASGRTHEISDIIKDLLQEVATGRARQNSLETRVALLEAALHRGLSGRSIASQRE